MGVCYELVVVADSDVDCLTEDDFYTLDLPWEDTGGLTLELLGELLEVLSEQPLSKGLDEVFPLVSADDIDGGPWAYKIPDEMVALLEDVQDEEADEIAESWIPDPEPMSYPRTVPYLAKEWLESLRLLSKQATSNKKSMFLRITL